MESRSVIIVHVRLLGFLARLSEHKELDVEIEAGSTVSDLIHLVAARLGNDFRQAVLDWHGNLHGGIELVLNQQHIAARKIAEITLWNDSNLTIVPLIGGGQKSISKEVNYVPRRIHEQAA